MTTNTMSAQVDKNRLQLEFDALKRECAEVLKLMSSARQVAYENYAKIYFWWSAASRVEGFVEGMTSHIASYKHRAVNHGINFSPLLIVLFNNTLSDMERNRSGDCLTTVYRVTVIYAARQTGRNFPVVNLASLNIHLCHVINTWRLIWHCSLPSNWLLLNAPTRFRPLSSVVTN